MSSSVFLPFFLGKIAKIRTYNYPQNRVTDHRIGFTVMNLDRVMEGDLDAILEALITEDQRRILAGEE